jgi:heme exporter protein CcmD
MINWLDNPQASYVIAAYGIALFCLAVCAAASFLSMRRREREWRALQPSRNRAEETE